MRHAKSPLFYNDTRWYGKYFMLERWLDLHETMKLINSDLRAREANPKLITVQSNTFKKDVEKFTKYFKHFHKTHQKMQERGLTFAECRAQLDGWAVLMNTDIHEDNDLFDCDLELKYIADNANIVENVNFERGVVKIQRGETDKLTVGEKLAVHCLTVSQSGASAEDSAAVDLQIDPYDASPTKIAEKQERKRKLDQAMSTHTTSYINSDFIVGSVAEVERLWSLARHVLTYDRATTMPLHVESLLYLKVNTRFWDAETVQEAWTELKNEGNEQTDSSLLAENDL